jgi:hypothetical protein
MGPVTSQFVIRNQAIQLSMIVPMTMLTPRLT